MKTEHMVYGAYIVFFLLLVGSIFIVPIMAFGHDMEFAYEAFSYTCHQKISRSYCIFNDGSNWWIVDCTVQNGDFVNTLQDRETVIVQDTSGTLGYKIPVCSRDVGIYTALLVGGLAYPLARNIGSKHVFPAIWLILAIVPLGLDGTVQLLSELGLVPFIYESTNTIRLLTGLLAGAVSAFYAIPVLMNMFVQDSAVRKKTAKNH